MRFATAVTIIAGVLFGCEPVYAQSIRACVNQNSGQIRMLVGDSCPAGFTLIEWSVASAQGVAGPQGPAGPAGPAGAPGETGPAGPGALLVTDAVGGSVGTAIDPYAGTIARKVGDDWVVFQVPSSGFTPYPMYFYHSTPDCSDARYLMTTSGQGYAFYAVVRGSHVFYTRTTDPGYAIAIPVHSYERVDVGQVDPTAPGTCVAWEGGARSMGVVTAAVDTGLGALVAPFQIR